MEIKTFGQSLDDRYVNEGDGGGSSGVGTATIVWDVSDPDNPLVTVTTSGFTAYDDVITGGYRTFSEMAVIDLSYILPPSASGAMKHKGVFGTHAFSLSKTSSESLWCESIDFMIAVTNENEGSPVSAVAIFSVYRKYVDGAWTDWADNQTNIVTR